MISISRIFIYSLLVGWFSLSAQAELQTVSHVDLSQYLGTWYQIARNPLPFEAGCVCSRQVLAGMADGTASVYNSCNDQSVTGGLREIRGTATNADPATNAKFKVDFGFPRLGDYWIIGLDETYRYAVVSDPSTKTLYILAKTPTLAPELYAQAVKDAATQVDTTKLQMTLQEGCNYPSSVVKTTPPLPAAPTDAAHPGSKIYAYGVARIEMTCDNRAVNVFMPVTKSAGERFPVVVYGHGQALDLDSYQETFEHLAGKGVAVIFPTYDTGFFDQDWTRMGRDYVTLTQCAFKALGKQLDSSQIVFSGHSKGAYVAGVAAGVAVKEKLGLSAQSVVLIEPAGIDDATIEYIEPKTTTTVVFSDQDTVVKRDISDSIYAKVKSLKKQFIFMKSYGGQTATALKADHFWPLTKASYFGGGPASALHYYGAWKWLVAAALDLKAGGTASNSYLYGRDAADKGVPGFYDDIQRSW